jgi:hypothetical protein
MGADEQFRRDIKNAEHEVREAEAPVGCLLGLLEALGLWSRQSRIIESRRRLAQAMADYDKLLGQLEDRETLEQLLTNTVNLGGVTVLKATFLDLSLDGNATYPPNWEELRGQILARDNWCCQETDAYCRGPLQIHHRRLLSEGGSNYPANLVTLCAYHHALKHPDNPRMAHWLLLNR